MLDAKPPPSQAQASQEQMLFLCKRNERKNQTLFKIDASCFVCKSSRGNVGFRYHRDGENEAQ